MSFESINTLMLKAIEDGIFPGGALVFSKAGRMLFNEVYGCSNIFTKRPVTRNTFFDLASLTKPLATTLAIFSLVQKGKIGLEQTLGKIIGQFQHTPKAEIQIRHLLCHNSGLPAYQPYYFKINEFKFTERKTMLKNLLIQEPLVSEIGSTTLYSDVGFMILEWVVENTAGVCLDQYLDQEVYGPLGIHPLFYLKQDSPILEMDVAATEVCPWRGRLIHGEVHDENAFIMGGVAGHSGLFGTAESVHQLLSFIMEIHSGEKYHTLFPQGLIRLFLTHKDKSGRALGFDTPSATAASCGNLFNKAKTVGHLGFTGTSFWMDLHQSVIVVLLTNRIHPTRTNEGIKIFRPLLHDTIMKTVMTYFGE
jgi:serine-type D-Ala-D-Ala carboxypeptidase